MSESSDNRSNEFLKISGQFKLGALVTESSHLLTAALSDVAKTDIAHALDLLFQVDADVLAKYREFVESGRASQICETVVSALRNGGRIFFTGCGSTGRLSIQLVSIWRDFWQRTGTARSTRSSTAAEWEDRTFSVTAGGDFALIKAVEGFEDFAAFGEKQLSDLRVSERDVVFAITEGGETSFVIGTVWKGVEAGAKVYFVYNNPDDVLSSNIERSREVIQDQRVEKINLTTGPMAITGSTRMQATTIELGVLLTIMEMVVRELTSVPGTSPDVPARFLGNLVEVNSSLRSPQVLSRLAHLVTLEESIYSSGHRTNYYADRFAIDVLTDTTERSPTYCTPPFRRFDDLDAAESWAFLFLPDADTSHAWNRILKREPDCIRWTENEVRALVPGDQAARTWETVRKISIDELMRFKIGLEGLQFRPMRAGDGAIAILSEEEGSQDSATDFFRDQLNAARRAGARSGAIFFCATDVDSETALRDLELDAALVVPLPKTDFLLDGITRVAVKMVLNALSTCTMVRMGRVSGNIMVWVVPTNLKLIDRATRYIQLLTGLTYEAANRLLFEVIEYVEPRMKADQQYPPVVALAVTRTQHGLSNESAEKRLERQ